MVRARSVTAFCVLLAAFFAVIAGLTSSDSAAVSDATSGSQQAVAAVPATGAIGGVVIDGASKSPVAGALVVLSGRAGPPLGTQTRQITDGKGRFVFVNLPPSDAYGITASKAGYFDGGYGHDTTHGATSAPIALGDGEWFPNARVTLWPSAAIRSWASMCGRSPASASPDGCNWPSER
jgi:hypothetical protein